MPWTHVARLWTNGEVFLALDADLLGAWRGSSNGDYEQLVELDPEATTVPVGTGTAAVVATDGEVGDEGWLEVLRDDDGAVCVVQVNSAEYPATLRAALAHPLGEDGGTVAVGPGGLALISAALDGTGPESAPLDAETPGPLPVEDPPEEPSDPLGGGVHLRVPAGRYGVQLTGYTEAGEDAVFNRVLIRPLGG